MSRSFSHWSASYLWNRSKEKLYRRQNPDLPWFSPQAIEFLADYLLPSDTGLEFGSGRSTLWFAQKVGQLTSVEHNADWAEKVKAMLAARSLQNAELVFAPKLNGANPDIEHSEYVGVTSRFVAESLDFVVVDGIYRAQCALHSLPLLKRHAMLIIDNVNKALPSASKSPNSRSIKAGPDGETWTAVWRQIKPWRRFWTSNGVSDTAFFFKP